MSNKTIDIGIKIDLEKLISSRLLVQASSGGGKSYAIRKLAEKLIAHVQVIIIDIEGEFVSLREKFPFALVSKQGEIPLNIRYAETLAHKLLETNLSAVIDLSEMEVYQRRIFLKRFATALIESPKNLWHPCVVIIDEADFYCMDSKTEILTSNGWKNYKEVSIGDLAVGFDLKTEQYKYEPIQRVIIKEHDGPMIEIKNDAIDCLVTPDHRVVIGRTQRGPGREYKKYPWAFCQAEKVPTNVMIPKGGCPFGEGLGGLSNDILSAIGWVITDGYFAADNKKRYLSVCQSNITCKNSVNISDKMESILCPLGATIHNRPPRSYTGKDGRIKKSSSSRVFYFGKKLSSCVLNYLGGNIHRIPREILNRCSFSQLEILFESLMEGDGTAGYKGQHKWAAFYAGLNEGLADDVQELCLKLGIRSVKRFEPSTNQYSVQISNRKNIYIRKKNQVSYSGIVWDITLPSGSFVARRNGKSFVTGNCPQGKDSESTNAVINLSSRGRKRGISVVYATQRIAKLHKDATADVLNKIIGLTGQDIDQARAGSELGFNSKEDIRGLRKLQPGEFYGFGPAISNEVIKFKVSKVETKHMEAGYYQQAPSPTPNAIKKILGKLASIPEEAEKELTTKQQLQDEIKRLNGELKKKPAAAESKVYVQDEKLKEQILDLKNELHTIKIKYNGLVTTQRVWEKAVQKSIDTLQGMPGVKVPMEEVAKIPVPPRVELAKTYSHPVKINVPSSGNGTIVGGAMRMLKAAKMFYPKHITRTRMGAFARLSHTSGSFGTYLSSLRTQGYIIGEGNNFTITDAGYEAAGEVDTLPTDPQELINLWCGIIGESSGAARMLRVLGNHFPNEMTRQELGDAVSMSSASGSFGTYLSYLSGRGLVKKQGQNIKASEELFL